MTYNIELSKRLSIIEATDLVPINIAINPIAGKNLPRDMLDNDRPIDVYVNDNIIPAMNAPKNIGNVSIIQAHPLPLTNTSDM